MGFLTIFFFFPTFLSKRFFLLQKVEKIVWKRLFSLFSNFFEQKAIFFLIGEVEKDWKNGWNPIRIEKILDPNGFVKIFSAFSSWKKSVKPVN